MTKLTSSQVDYKFRLLEHSRAILRDAHPIITQSMPLAGTNLTSDYAADVITLAEKIHNWVYEIEAK